jgi:hypothetical protein
MVLSGVQLKHIGEMEWLQFDSTHLFYMYIYDEITSQICNLFVA